MPRLPSTQTKQQVKACTVELPPGCPGCRCQFSDSTLARALSGQNRKLMCPQCHLWFLDLEAATPRWNPLPMDRWPRAEFYRLAFELLQRPWPPPIPRLPDGQHFEPYCDPWLTDQDNQELCNIVCERVLGMTVDTWRTSTERKQIALMHSALAKQPRTESPHMPECGKQSKLEVLPGGFAYEGRQRDLTGRPLAMLGVLLASPHNRESADKIREKIAVDDEAVTYPEQVIRDTAKDLRKALKAALADAGKDRNHDPLPSIGRGSELAYRLNLP